MDANNNSQGNKTTTEETLLAAQQQLGRMQDEITRLTAALNRANSEAKSYKAKWAGLVAKIRAGRLITNPGADENNNNMRGNNGTSSSAFPLPRPETESEKVIKKLTSELVKAQATLNDQRNEVDTLRAQLDKEKTHHASTCKIVETFSNINRLQRDENIRLRAALREAIEINKMGWGGDMDGAQQARWMGWVEEARELVDEEDEDDE